MSTEIETSQKLSIEALLLALVTLEVDRRENTATDGQTKTEILLNAAGLTSQQVALIMGKNAAAVRMTLSRAKKPLKSSKKEPTDV